MMVFGDIKAHTPPTEICCVVSYRYESNEQVDLSSSMKLESQQSLPADITVTLAGHSSDLEIAQLSSSRIVFLERRQEILDSNFYIFNRRKKREKAFIDDELDKIERQIILLQKPHRDQEIAKTKKVIEDSARYLRSITSSLN